MEALQASLTKSPAVTFAVTFHASGADGHWHCPLDSGTHSVDLPPTVDAAVQYT